MLRLADDTFYRMMIVYMRRSEPFQPVTTDCVIKTGRLGAFDGIGIDERGPSYIKGVLIASCITDTSTDTLEFSQMYDHESPLSKGVRFLIKHTLFFSQEGGWVGIWQPESRIKVDFGQTFASVAHSSSDYPVPQELYLRYESWQRGETRVTGVTVH